ncbi:MAG: flippase, partial [Gammaproteobacteria bacterium]|nr:flippase [Gammaproteobacteria bacterium]
MTNETQAHIIFRSIHGTFWLIVGRTASLVAGIAATVFIVRKLGPEQYGYIPLINSILGMAMIVADGGLGPSTAFYLARYRNRNAAVSRLLTKTVWLRLITLVPVCILFYALIPSAAVFFSVPIFAGCLPIFMAGLLMALALSRWTEKAYAGLGEAGRLGKFQTCFSLASPICQALLVSMGFGVLGVIAGQVAANGALVIVLLLAMLLKFRRAAVKDTECADVVSSLAVIRYAMPLMVIHGSLFVFTQSAVLVLKYYHSIQEVSYYGLIAQIAVLTQIPALSLASATAPMIATLNQEKPERASALLGLSLRSLVIAYAPLVAFTALAAPAIITHVFSVEFLSAVPILRIYAPYILFYALGGFASMSLDYEGKARLRMWLVAGGALANLAFCFLLIPRHGTMGAAVATLVSHLPLIVTYLLLLKRVYRISVRRLPRFGLSIALATAVSALLLHTMLAYSPDSLPSLILG